MKQIGMIKSWSEDKVFDRIDDESMEFEWNYFQGFNTLQLSQQILKVIVETKWNSRNFAWLVIFWSLFNDISCGSINYNIEYELNTRFDFIAENVRSTEEFDVGRVAVLGRHMS